MSKSVKGKGKGEATNADVKPVWTSLMESILEAALIDHPHDYAGILRDPNYSETFKDYNRESLRRKWRSKLDRDAKKAGAGTSVQNNNIGADGQDNNAADMENDEEAIATANTLVYMANTDPHPMLKALETNNEALKTNNNMILQVLAKLDTIIDLIKHDEEEDKE